MKRDFKKENIYLLLSILAAITAAFLFGYIFQSTPTSNQESVTVEQPKPLKPSPLSMIPLPPIKERGKLWGNGERCSGVSVPSKPEDLVQINHLAPFLINIVEVNLTDDATCEDAERVATLINGKIVGFGPVTNLYGIQIPTRTVSELETAIQAVNNLNDPKIEGAFEAAQLQFHSVE